MINLKHFSFLNIFILFSICFPLKLFAREKKPNIIILLADDQRWDSIGVYGNPQVIHTPHLDKLASKGILKE